MFPGKLKNFQQIEYNENFNVNQTLFPYKIRNFFIAIQEIPFNQFCINYKTKHYIYYLEFEDNENF